MDIARDFRASAASGARLPPTRAPESPLPASTPGSSSSPAWSASVCFCSILNVPIGNTIDLREDGCSLDIERPSSRRYYTSVTVENPIGEPLTYDWRTYATQTTKVVLYSNLGSPSANF